MASPALFVMVVALCERAGYYTISTSLQPWLRSQGYSPANTTSVQQLFCFFSDVSCFVGGWLAETRFGRYKTILASAVCYVAGCLLAAAATHSRVESVPFYLVGCLALVTLGAGGIRPNAVTFGADQVDASGDDPGQAKESFFMYFYAMVTVGCLSAFGLLVIICTGGLPPLVAREDGLFCAYVVAGSLMAIASLTCIGGARLYRAESLQTNSEPVIRPFVARLWSCRGLRLGKVALIGWASLPCLVLTSVLQAWFPCTALTALNLALHVLCIGCLCAAHRSNAWMGPADGVTRCLDVVPALLMANVTFNVLYTAMSSAFYLEACQMDTSLGRGEDAMQLSGVFFNLANAVAIVAFTPLVTRCVCPWFERFTGRAFDNNLKVYAGIGAAMAAHLFAALMEVSRRGSTTLDIISNCAPSRPDEQHDQMRGMDAMWISVSYGLIGIGEVLVNPVLQSVAYQAGDPSMRSLLQAFNLFAMGGLPDTISAVLTQATASLAPNDPSIGNLPLVHLINIAVGVVGCIAYYCLTSSVERSPKAVPSDGVPASLET